MKKYMLLSALLVSGVANATIETAGGQWLPIGNTELKPVFSDLDNGDGAGDGAIMVDGLDAVADQGGQFIFAGEAEDGEQIDLSTYVYNQGNGFVAYNVELYNVNDDTVLVTLNESIPGNNKTPNLSNISYLTQASDAGDTLAIRYLRRGSLATFRNFNIDNLALNGEFASTLLTGLGTPCYNEFNPDLPLTPSSPEIDAELQLAFDSLEEEYLGTEAPSPTSLANAIAAYDALNIQVANNQVTGENIRNFTVLRFLRVFARHLKFSPDDVAIQEKVNNAVWLTSSQFCAGILRENRNGYDYRFFGTPTALMQDYLDTNVQSLYLATLNKHTNNWARYWDPVFDADFQAANGGMNTDLIYNFSKAMLAVTTWQDSADERYRYARAFKRMMDRFTSYTYGTGDGIKPDGTGYHHWTAYDHYMYSYESAADVISHLSGTRFQIEKDGYLRFRDAVYAQFVNSNDEGIKALSTSGRIVTNRKVSMATRAQSIKRLAIEGGKILGLRTADPVLAGVYNRRYGVEPDFNYKRVTRLKDQQGFYQFNHGNMGVYRHADRKSSWLAVNKGFSNNMWGTEIYPTQNRYGRYQSYGALEIIYPGDEETGIGFDVDTWDWNYNPGATSIVLPWDALHGERGRIDELQAKRFVGALSFKNERSTALNKTHGEIGMFAMDFQEVEDQGFDTVFGPNTHNSTFTFKKSNFFFGDIIVSLGSNINNGDASNPTVTTLSQRLDNKGDSVIDGVVQTESSLHSNEQNRWLVDNYNTGFLIVSGSGELSFNKHSQQTPNQNQTDPNDYLGNPVADYHLAYLNHGNAPIDASYEYLTLPNTTPKKMEKFAKHYGKRPLYNIIQQDNAAHIVENIRNNIWGYAFFEPIAALNNGGLLLSVSEPSLVMYNAKFSANKEGREGKRPRKRGEKLILTLVNPDVGLESRQFTPSVEKVIEVVVKGNFEIDQTLEGVELESNSDDSTLLRFTTVDGMPLEVHLKRQ